MVLGIFLVWFSVMLVCFNKLMFNILFLLFNLYRLIVILSGMVWLFVVNGCWKVVLILLGVIIFVGFSRLNMFVVICFFCILVLKFLFNWFVMVLSSLLLVFWLSLLLMLENWLMLIKVVYIWVFWFILDCMFRILINLLWLGNWVS